MLLLVQIAAATAITNSLWTKNSDFLPILGPMSNNFKSWVKLDWEAFLWSWTLFPPHPHPLLYSFKLFLFRAKNGFCKRMTSIIKTTLIRTLSIFCCKSFGNGFVGQGTKTDLRQVLQWSTFCSKCFNITFKLIFLSNGHISLFPWLGLGLYYSQVSRPCHLGLTMEIKLTFDRESFFCRLL